MNDFREFEKELFFSIPSETITIDLGTGIYKIIKAKASLCEL